MIGDFDLLGGSTMDPVDMDVHFPQGQPEGELSVESSEVFALVDELQCILSYRNETSRLGALAQQFCDVTTDTVFCWPPTSINQTVFVKCFAELDGVLYDDTKNASRQCLWNGTWSKSDYSQCKEILDEIVPNELEGTVIDTSHVYLIGYTISLITLAVAVGIFTCFKELRCLRNTIHMNLMWAYILNYCVWIILLVIIQPLNLGDINITCLFMVTAVSYFILTTFFWMFVEGLYLYILVVETLSRENFKLRIYVCVGWGIPIIIIVIWSVVKAFLLSTFSGDEASCAWSNNHLVDWIHVAPIFLVLIANVYFLIAIMWVLITKLRSSNTVETQQYHKAAKALMVLMPLLGLSYVLTLYRPLGPGKGVSITIIVFENIRAILSSTQGFTVALFYCFLNTEVQTTIKHRLETWKASRSLGPNRLRNGSKSKDWSARSRTESIRGTEWTLVMPDDVDNHRIQNSQSSGGHNVS